MPARPLRFTRALSASAVIAVVTLVPGVASAARAQGANTVPLETWAATFCTSFAAYETDALAAQQQMQMAFAGVENATAGAEATAALGGSFAATSESAKAAATATSANGIPDLANGKQLAAEIEATLIDTSTAYAKAAKQSSSMPTAPRRLQAAVTKLAKRLAAALDPASPHAKRLKRLDRGNKVAQAISSDPTCVSASSATGTTTAPATNQPAP
jgi:hypothetical protein